MRHRWMFLAILTAGCQAGAPVISVEVVSDLVIGDEVTQVRAELSDRPFTDAEGLVQQVTLELTPADDLSAGVRVAELVATSRIQHVRVTLLDAYGRPRAQRIAVVPGVRPVVRLTLARSCLGVLCPSIDGGGSSGDSATSCVNGACVVPECVDAATCPAELLCAADADCTGASACQRAVCSEGECLMLDTCGAGERCVDGACTPAARCGDGTCDPGSETACGCEADCGPCAASCGNGLCDEPSDACPEDCGPPGAACGDRLCDVSLESVVSCPEDCEGSAALPVCGDDRCEGGEACGVCPECCEERGCGDGVCDPSEAPCGCEADCGVCLGVCGDGRCDAGEACEEDCEGAPVCGDGVCTPERESCAGCERDCGWCTGVPSVSAEETCAGAPLQDDEVCGGIAGAYTNASVNLAYYPMRVVGIDGADVVTGELDAGGRVIHHLPPDARFAVQSTRNPGCMEAPPLRPARDGHFFGYVPGTEGPDAIVGWVVASDLVVDDLASASACAYGPTGRDFAVRLDPYARPASCTPIDCDAGDELLRLCSDANPPGEALGDCGGRTLNDERAVAAETLQLRYAPAGPPRRFAHQGDRVRVLYESGREGWVFVQLLESAAPALSPPGSRGWVLASHLE